MYTESQKMEARIEQAVQRVRNEDRRDWNKGRKSTDKSGFFGPVPEDYRHVDAEHEIGHLVKPLDSGWQVNWAEVHHGGGGLCSYTAPPSATLEQKIMASLAGPLAEGVGLSSSGAQGALGDREDVLIRLRAAYQEHKGPFAPDELSDERLLDIAAPLWQWMQDLLEEHGCFIKKSADILVARGRLEGAEIQAMWDDYKAGNWY